MTSQKSFQQLTMEKEQALADLNSVERSLSDLFRRYENLKGVLEGFKKVACPFLFVSLVVYFLRNGSLNLHASGVGSLLNRGSGPIHHLPCIFCSSEARDFLSPFLSLWWFRHLTHQVARLGCPPPGSGHSQSVARSVRSVEPLGEF